MAKFQRGQSGNPGGRPKQLADIQALAREHTAAAIERLAHWMRSDDARASVAASAALLDRAWGKAVASVTIREDRPPPSEPIEVTARWLKELLSEDRPDKGTGSRH